MRINPVIRARALIGTRFRAQGHDPRTGLDCLGLAICAHAIPGQKIRRDYRLRGDHRAELLSAAKARFRRIARTERRPGDLLLLDSGHGQSHLAILTDVGFVHADASIGRVVETPGEPCWPLLAVLRRRTRSQKAG